jgi:hypothetical protein
MTATGYSTMSRLPLGARARIALLCACLLACAGDLVEIGGENDRGGTLESRKLGFRISNLAVQGEVGDPAPERIDLEGADLAYRDAAGSVFSLGTRCRNTRAPIAILARHLTIGTPREAILAAGPVELKGDPGWVQTFDSHEASVSLRIKAVTLAGGRCVYDWMLVSPGAEPFARAEPLFDGWWQSFERDRSSDEGAADTLRTGDPP